ncbi:DUF975 family protein [Zongyangia hominis]|uniref:DUF975 family protein n=1 Tax=Zongyangia hominis TaxID=2763677 RepID=A0A926EDE6_9FIRM|nr:DUF975 family protein [Zongyangia hominis]MBC8571030.1 DUF975 family protein [Zongyangia hominis]
MEEKMLRRKIKRDARSALCNNWGKAVCILMIMLAVGVLFALFESVISVALGMHTFRELLFLDGYAPEAISVTRLALSGAMLLLSFLVLAPLSIGVLQWYYRITGGESPEISSIFAMFSSMKTYWKSIWLSFNITIRSAIWTAFLTGPGALILYWGVQTLRRVEGNTGKALAITGILSGLVLFLLGTVFLLTTLSKYLLAFYLFAEGPEVKVSEAIRASLKYTWEHRFRLFGFFLSFLPWFILCILMVPVLYVAPYLSCATAIYARYLIQLGRSKEMEATKAYEAPVHSDAPVVDVADYNEEIRP